MNNLKKARENKGLSQKEVAITLGVSAPMVSEWEKGKKNPKIANQRKLAELYGVSLDFLFGTDASLLQGNNFEVANLPDNNYKIPVLGTIPCGVPIEAVENVIGYEYIPKDWMSGDVKYFGLKIKGDSMSPVYLEGDIVIIRQQPDFKNGNDCIVYVNSDYEGTLKRVYKTDNGLQLVPLNNNYAPQMYTLKEVATLPIIIGGVVVEIRRKMEV